MNHPDEDQLLDYAEKLLDFEPTVREWIAGHLLECLDCTEQLDKVKRFSASMSDPVAWNTAGAKFSEAKNTLVQLHEQIRLERKFAESHLPLRLSKAGGAESLVQIPEAQTLGSVEFIIAEAHRQLDRDPHYAQQLAQVALEIGSRLRTQGYPPLLLKLTNVHALKESANALRHLGRYRESLEVLDRADALIVDEAAAGFDRAILQFVRGVVLFKMEQLDSARQCLNTSAETFIEFGDRERYDDALLMQGNILFEQGSVLHARELFESQFQSRTGPANSEIRARLALNIAACCTALGENDAAASFFALAEGLFSSLGLTTEALRARWNQARMLLPTSHEQAIAALESCRHDFLALDMIMDAAFVELDLAEALLNSGETQRATAVCRRLAETFVAAGTSSSASVVLSHLRDAATGGLMDVGIVQYVRDFLMSEQQETGSSLPLN